ncbi:Gfo/Idh/MocA family oxidoreductase [Salipaludibacillus sp. LMS25]|jgi:predicted dehydrogenase|uniref:Gfo/Idh/MocA family protein n=1 Tax=Salipaludibacillus sp. LMS25 TaxID=2924031 RepID=UPI0020D0511F|nr:Gfo/Idh/MocA family oxidoreductase [Salipaludibacillus sp. LMS25]UTR15328.1 Gfo/Idh/MocA family oxidoreductase [Salipaludibacillus sp. LMS25]
MSIAIGLIGCGAISRKHLKTIANVDSVQLRAVSDVDDDKMSEAVERYRTLTGDQTFITKLNDYKALIKREDVDAVVVALLSSMHATVAKEALKAGKHVMLEKPIALSLQDTDELINLQRLTNNVVLVCHQLRYRPVFQKIKWLMDEGVIGKPYYGTASLKIYRPKHYYSSAAWRGSWDKDGGMLVNQGIHLIDLLIWLLGDVHSVYGQIGRYLPFKETEDVASGVLQFENGARAVLDANSVTLPNNLGYELTLVCDKATISLKGALDQLERCFVESHPEIEKELNLLMNDTREHEYMYEDFVKSIKTTKSVKMSCVEGKKAFEVIGGLYLSHLKNNVITFPIESFSTSDMKGSC